VEEAPPKTLMEVSICIFKASHELSFDIKLL